MQSLQVLAQAQAQAAHMAAQAQSAAQQQAGVQQQGPPGQDGSQSEPPGFTYRNRARRKASEKPHVSYLNSYKYIIYKYIIAIDICVISSGRKGLTSSLV